ncbi:MAG: ABC1 kinase family protein, partial [Chitinophagales bacterium]
DMGGLLIKLGQFFSSRVDILPKKAIAELALLQDEVNPVPFLDIKQVIEDQFGRPLDQVFVDFKESPIASASLGQVHHGTLPNGEKVAIKIQKPGIDKLVKIDLTAIRRAVSMLRMLTKIEDLVDLEAIYQEFAETIWLELDYLQEGRNSETVAENQPNLIIPKVHWDYTTVKVLTMEYVEGIKINDYEEMDRIGINRSMVAKNLVDTYFHQVLVDGFFHADPHPGNLFVKPDGRIVMVDFGMMGSISPGLKKVLIKMVVAMVKRDNQEVVHYLKEVGFLRPEADNDTIGRVVGIALEEFLGQGLEFSEADFSGLLKNFEVILYEQPFQVPANFTFLGRALGTLYGICIGLDPDISFLDVAKPYLGDLTREQTSSWSKGLLEKILAWGNAFLEGPPLAEQALRRIDRGDFTVRVPLNPVVDSIRQNTAATRSIAWAVVFGSSLLASSYLLVHGFTKESYWGFGFSGVILLFLILKSRNKKTRHLHRPAHGLTRRDNP